MKDTVLTLMEKAGIPITRGNYLKVAFLGDSRQPLDAEVEAELPDSLEIELVFLKTKGSKDR
jgi:hypothetical protein